MSFSGNVKEELSKTMSGARHCQIAEIAAITAFDGKIVFDKTGHVELRLATENIFVAKKYFTMIKKTFNILPDVAKRNGIGHKTGTYFISVKRQEDVIRILSAIKVYKEDGSGFEDLSVINGMLLMNTCCKRAFLRGTFLAAGSVGDPNKSYHLELVCPSEIKAIQIRDVIRDFNIDAKIVARKSSFVVYLKEGAGIVEFLNVIEAHVALMDLENVRIVKEMRNSVNRQVNCETANINKTITASMKQIEDIELIRDTLGLDSLSDNLRKMAEVRLANPDVPLNELGNLLIPPIGKSGVNHRLRKISEIAEELRVETEKSEK